MINKHVTVLISKGDFLEEMKGTLEKLDEIGIIIRRQFDNDVLKIFIPWHSVVRLQWKEPR